MSNAAAMDKKKDKKPHDHAAKPHEGHEAEKEHKQAAHVAAGAAKIVDKALGKGYADQKASLKPKEHGAHGLGPKTDDKKKIGVAEAAHRAAEEHHPGEGKQEHPLHDAKKTLQNAEKHAHGKAAVAADPKKKHDDHAPDAHSKHDEDKKAKHGGKKEKPEDHAKKQEKGATKKHSDHAKEAAGAAALAKDKAHGKKDDKGHSKVKADKTKKHDDHHEQGAGTPAEALAAEVIKAAKDKKAEKKGRKKSKAQEEAVAHDEKKKQWWGNAGQQTQEG